MKCSLRRCWLGVRGSPRMPWENVHVRLCNAAGTPCKKCNPSDLANPPRPPAGTRIEFDERVAALTIGSEGREFEDRVKQSAPSPKAWPRG